MRTYHIIVAITFTIVLTVHAMAQVPPGKREIANYTGLLLAAHNNDADEVSRLVADGANPDVTDKSQRTPVHVATYNSSAQALRALVAAGANIRAFDNQAYDAITIAAVANDVEMLRLAIELGGDVRAITSPYIGTALIASAHLGHVEVVNTLIAAGAPLDHVNNLGWTALLEAVILGDGGERHRTIVKALMAAGADPLLADDEDTTPYQHAVQRGYTKMAIILRR